MALPIRATPDLDDTQADEILEQIAYPRSPLAPKPFCMTEEKARLLETLGIRGARRLINA